MFRRLWKRHSHLRDAGITVTVLGIMGVLVFTWLPPRKKPAHRPGPPVAGNAYPLAEALINPATDLSTRMQKLPEVMQYAEFTIPGGTAAASPATLRTFLDYQILAKLARVESVFLLLEGRRTESLALLSATFYLGRLMSEDGMSMPGMIGVALMHIAEGGLEIQILNATETAADRRLLWDTLNDLDARTPPPEWSQYKSKLPLLARLLTKANEAAKDGFARHQHAYAKFHLLRAAVAAQEHRAASGKWPLSPTDFAPWLPSGPPPDVFSPSSVPYRYSVTGSGDFSLWSIGPDMVNNGAAVQYDPTNGAISGGDIVLEIPRDRKHQFPTSGTALRAGEIASRFPAGLPPDPFADTRGRGLSVSTTGSAGSVASRASETSAAVIYSFGPDTDESRTADSGTVDEPEVQYDPTNGTTSEGDLLRVVEP